MVSFSPDRLKLHNRYAITPLNGKQRSFEIEDGTNQQLCINFDKFEAKKKTIGSSFYDYR
jgi:hypothetical protein